MISALVLINVQRGQVNETAQSLLEIEGVAELSGTQFKVTRLYRSIPGIALRVGLDALQVLERSPAVTNVVADRPVSVSR